jgi:hypothetical protein
MSVHERKGEQLRKRLTLAGVTIAAMATLFAVTILAPAGGASATQTAHSTRIISTTPNKPGPRGEYMFGPIENAAHRNWCVTAPVESPDHAPLFMAQCVPGDGWQTWNCTQFRGIGECSLSKGSQPLDVGQYGKNDSRVKVINPDKGGNYNYILGYTELSGGRYLIRNHGYFNFGLAMPVKFVKDRVFPIHWFAVGEKGYTYTVVFPKGWKPDPSIAPADVTQAV